MAKAPARKASSKPTSTAKSTVPETKPSLGTPRARSFRELIREPIVNYYAFIVTVLALTGFGLLMVFSSSVVDLVSQGNTPYYELISQSVFAVIGLVVGVVAVFIPVKLYRLLSFVVLLIALGLQLLTVAGLGVSSGGNMGWIIISGFSFQPAEVLKLALCLWMPQAIVSAQNLKKGSIAAFVLPAALFAVGFLLVLVGRDLGTGIIIILIGAVALFAGGLSLKVFISVGAIGVVGIVGLFVLGSSNRMNRVAALLNGCSDAADAQSVCYQTIHGLYAIGSGGLTGVGLGASREKWNYLPEAHNDFIFAIIGEELGFLGAGVVVLCFAILAWSLIHIAMAMKNKPYERLVLICITVWLVGQALINIMVVLQLLPVIGLPLPFVSAGGTALIMCLIASGVAVRMAREQDDIKAVVKRA